MTEDERKLHLDYLGRVHVALTETGKRINTTLVAQTLVAFVTLAICLDIVATAPEYSVGGLRLTFAAPFVTIAGAFTCCALLLQQFGLLAHESVLQILMMSLYRDLGFKHDSLSDRIAHPLEHPNIATSVVSFLIVVGFHRL